MPNLHMTLTGKPSGYYAEFIAAEGTDEEHLAYFGPYDSVQALMADNNYDRFTVVKHTMEQGD